MTKEEYEEQLERARADLWAVHKSDMGLYTKRYYQKTIDILFQYDYYRDNISIFNKKEQ